MGHKERKIREKADMKARILDAALKIAIANGWQAVTIRGISQAIEYTTSIVYGHFESKEALLRELTNSGFRMLYLEGEKVLSENLAPAEQLLKLSLVTWDFALNNAELFRLMFSNGQPVDENATRGIALVKDIFIKLTGKKGRDADLLVLNWNCLRHGCINILMQFNKGKSAINQREIFIQFINRFISSIK
jgi:AcrR family transcriptional regulator